MAVKTVLITGGSSGIGLATAKLFTERGFRVFNLDIAKPLEASKTEFIQCDLASCAQIQAAITQLMAQISRLDVVVYSAGVHLSANIEQTSEQDFLRLTSINMAGCFFTLKYIMPHMRAAQSGAIVLVSSDQAFIGKKNSAAYGMTKAAIAQLTKSLALDYADHGIRINCVCPGTIDTPLYQKAIANYAHQTGLSLQAIELDEALQQPLGRVGQPHEVAELIYFLSDETKSGFMTGGLYPIDGGYTAK